MLIAKAYAAGEAAAPNGLPTDVMTEAPSAFEAFALNMLLIVILVVMFYVLLIMPQQKRFQKHREMLNALKKGDRVVTAGGLVGSIEKITEGDDEVLLDLGNGVKVTALRSSIQAKTDKHAPKADKSKKEDKKDGKKEDEAA